MIEQGYKQRRYTLWWYEDEQGVIHKQTVFQGEPTPTAPWQPGRPPLIPEMAAYMRTVISKVHTGKPKTIVQRLKMSQAKLGVPKSHEHRANMSQAHLERCARVRALMEERPELTYHQASTLEASLRKKK